MENPTSEKNKKSLTPNEKAKSSQLNLKDYQQLKAKEAQKEAKTFRLPTPVKMIFAIPLLLLCLFGLIYIPYLLFSLLTAPK